MEDKWKKAGNSENVINKERGGAGEATERER